MAITTNCSIVSSTNRFLARSCLVCTLFCNITLHSLTQCHKLYLKLAYLKSTHVKLGMHLTGLCYFIVQTLDLLCAMVLVLIFNFYRRTKLKLEQIQTSATKIIFPDVSYPTRLAVLELYPLSGQSW